MSSRSSWGNEEKTIIYRELGAIWTWDEYLTSSKQEDKMIETVQHPITLIIDASHSLSLPNGSIGQFKHALEDYCQPCEKQILVSTHQAYWTLHRLIIQMLPEAKERFFIVRTVEEAYQLAEQNKRKPLAY
jgi:hypothetical protein